MAQGGGLCGARLLPGGRLLTGRRVGCSRRRLPLVQAAVGRWGCCGRRLGDLAFIGWIQ